MDSWERFDEISLPDKKPFYCELYLEDITDKDYTHAQKVFKELELKNLGDCHDIVCSKWYIIVCRCIENFRNKCIEIYELDPTHFLSAPGLAWQACSKKAEVEAELLLILICYWWLKKELKAEYVVQYIGMLKK